MCGIIGYAGTKNAHGVLIDGLKALEYRGYDSSGLAVFCLLYTSDLTDQGYRLAYLYLLTL